LALFLNLSQFKKVLKQLIEKFIGFDGQVRILFSVFQKLYIRALRVYVHRSTEAQKK
jgi:hypothetical protein